VGVGVGVGVIRGVYGGGGGWVLRTPPHSCM